VGCSDGSCEDKLFSSNNSGWKATRQIFCNLNCRVYGQQLRQVKYHQVVDKVREHVQSLIQIFEFSVCQKYTSMKPQSGIWHARLK